MVTEQERQSIVDAEQLRLLPVFFWVLAGVEIFISLYGLIYVAFGGMIVALPWDEAAADAPPAFLGWYLLLLGLGFLVFFAGGGVLKILAGVWIKRRQHRTAVLVIAGLACLDWPFGIVLAIFTFMLLLRPSVAALFGTPVPAAGAPSTAGGPSAL